MKPTKDAREVAHEIMWRAVHCAIGGHTQMCDEVTAVVERDRKECAETTSVAGDALALAIRFHETYERLAPSFGYATRTETRQFDQTTPNGRLMVAVCAELTAPAVSLREGTPRWMCPGCASTAGLRWKRMPAPLDGGCEKCMTSTNAAIVDRGQQ